MEAERLAIAEPTTFRADFWRVRDYPGYTVHQSWNGWACPCFEKALADRIMAYLAADAAEDEDAVTLAYRGENGRDAYDLLEPREDGEGLEVAGTAEGFNLATVHGVKRVYAIGAFLWTWQERGVHFDRDAAQG